MPVITLEGDKNNFYRIMLGDDVIAKLNFSGSSKGTPVSRTVGAQTYEMWNVMDDLFVDIYVDSTIDNLPWISIDDVPGSLDSLATRHTICSIKINMAHLDPRFNKRHQIVLRDIV